MAQSDRRATGATYARVQALAAELSLDEAAWRRALELAELAPGPREWLRHLDRFLVVVGTALVVAGVTAFFAWNWADLHRLAKLALVEAGILGSALLAWRFGLDGGGGRACLFATAFLVGVLLAVFGQAYQTGADPYGLFLAWSAFTLPLAVVGRQAGLWLLLVVLLDLTLILYWIQVLHPPDGWWQLSQLLGPLVWLGTTVMDWRLASLLFALNALAIVAWEAGARRGMAGLGSRWFPRIVATFALYTVLGPTLVMIFAASLDHQARLGVVSPVLYAASLAAMLWYYQSRERDLLMLTFAIFGAILVVMSLAIRHLFHGMETMLVLALLLIAQVAGAAWWLRHVARRWEDAT